MDDKIIFCVRSPLGYTVSCSQKVWNGHITPGHPEILGREDDVLHTVEEPYKIFLSKTQKSRHVYYSNPIDYGRHGLYTKVVIGPSCVPASEYTVVTAYKTGRISEDNGKGVMIYDATSQGGL